MWSFKTKKGLAIPKSPKTIFCFKLLLSITLFLTYIRGNSQQRSIVTPFYSRDSLTISGKVIDEMGKPVENALVLFTPFYTKKYDVIWYEKDTTLTDISGQFLVKCTISQIRHNLYFKKEGYIPNRHFINKIEGGAIYLDTPVVLFNRIRNWFTAKNITEKDLGMTVSEAVKKYKLNMNQATLTFAISSNGSRKRILEAETADSSQITLFVDDFIDASTTDRKQNILDKRITGIGIAYTNGEKTLLGIAEQYHRKVYNEYYLEKEAVKEK